METTGNVAPLAGAWIETYDDARPETAGRVAPLAGAWIETQKTENGQAQRVVAPLAGAWIETATPCRSLAASSSRPSRARGLKQLSEAS